jgi:membrane protease YdiL (CAAX protease family)
MKSFLKFAGIFGGIILLSALLAPPLHDILPYKFERIFNRLVMVFTLIAIVFFVRISPQTFAKYGLNWTPLSPKMIGLGFGTGVLILCALTVLKIGAGVAYWNMDVLPASRWLYKFAVILPTAFLIGVIEEFFFRGFIYKFFRERVRWNAVTAVVVTSIFYSLIHFVSEKKPFIGPDPNFKDALTLATAPFLSLAEWQTYWRDAVGLFCFGLVLNRMAIRTASLYLSIGLHAGCVFFVKLDGLFVEFLNNHPFLWGSAKMYDGLIGWGFLLLMGVFLEFALNRFCKPSPTESRR